MSEFQFFKFEDFACRHCGHNEMDREVIRDLDRLRTDCEFPLIVVSGYRCPVHNMAVSSSGPSGPHTTGKAVDFRVYGARAWRLVDRAMGLGFSGIGVQQKGPIEKRFIHLDRLYNRPDRPRPTVWSY